jgi:hypothetical protein
LAGLDPAIQAQTIGEGRIDDSKPAIHLMAASMARGSL